MSATKHRLSAPERKKQILKCAAGVFSRSSYTAAKVADIARAADISEAMIYKHFSSKKEIFLCILKNLSKGLNRFWQENSSSKDNPLETLRQVTILYYREAMKRPETMRVQFLALSEVQDKEIMAQLQQDYLRMGKFIQTLLNQGVEQGLVRTDVDVAAVASLGLAGGLLTHIMAILSLQQDYPEELVAGMIDHLINSIKV